MLIIAKNNEEYIAMLKGYKISMWGKLGDKDSTLEMGEQDDK